MAINRSSMGVGVAVGGIDPDLNTFIVGGGTEWEGKTLAETQALLGISVGVFVSLSGDTMTGNLLMNAGSGFLNEVSTATNPIFIPHSGDLTTGIGGISGEVSFIAGGVEQLNISSTGVSFTSDICVANANGSCLKNEASSGTNPTVVSDRTDPTTGLGGLAGEIDLIQASVSILHVDGNDTTLISRGASGTSGAALDILAGDCLAGGFDGGFVTIAAGAGEGTGLGGDVDIDGGTGGATGDGGFVNIRGGPASGTAGFGGDVVLIGGLAQGADDGGQVRLTGGNGGSGGGAGGLVNVIAGNGNAAGAGGAVQLVSGTGGVNGSSGALSVRTGNAGASAGNSGNITIQTGTAVAGTVGDILFNRNAVATFEIDATGGTAGFRAANAAGPAVLNEAATVTNPVFIPDRGSTTTGIGGDSGNDVVTIVCAGAELVRWSDSALEQFSSVPITLSNASGPRLQNEAASATNPTVIPLRTFTTSGMGGVGNNPYMVANGTAVAEFADNGAAVNRLRFTNAPTTLGPTIDVAGETNIDLTINTAGTGDLVWAIGGATKFTISGNTFAANIANGPAALNSSATDTVPTLIPNKAATTTGVGGASGAVTLVVTGTTRFEADATGIGFFGTTPAAQAAAYSPSNVTTDRTYDANSTTLDEIADVLGTLIADLQAYGLLQ